MKKFDNFISNLNVLEKAENEDLENEFVISGIIDKFFIQFELSWKVLKTLLRYEGKSAANSGSPREILKAAYSVYDFIDEDIWLDMLKSRNDMTHIYDGEAARRLVGMILKRYIPAFEIMKEKVLERYKDILDTI
ncbi:MAG TPA: HI0074 family nucleotidyltransferase substrate-binding subunit [Candidatus Mediterraneibacter stercoripullorum]|nr:HI0074 family nucleotidyltransferase substrate-binding subunit [Candidatus Mediterraneibacter stercoripullorum]